MKRIFFFLLVIVFSLTNCKQALKKIVLDKMIAQNDSLEQLTKSTIVKNDSLFNFIFKPKETVVIDSIYYDKARKVRTLNKKMIYYIGDLKEDLIMEVEHSNQDTIRLSSMKNGDDIDIPSYYLLNMNAERAEPRTKAYELIEEINNYKKDIITVIDPRNNDLRIGLNTEDEYSESEEKVLKWEIAKFYHQPTASIFCTLSQLQLEIAQNESKNINILFNVIQKSKGITQ